jgi:HAD superfamily hydrolase (TIGR01450 family)
MIEKTPGTLRRLKEIEAFALDMDGTVYLGARLLPGAHAFVARCRERGVPFAMLTNNSSKSRREYGAKLERLGLPVGEDGVMTSGEATIRYLHREHPGRRVYLVATPSYEQEVREGGVPLATGREDADLAVLAFDTGLTFQKLVVLCDIVRDGKPFVATHPDFNCPVDGGYIPDVGSFLALVHASTGRRPDAVIGKPGRLMVTALCERWDLPAERIAYVGDRLYTDVAMARESGMLGVLVLSGETTLADLDGSPHQPDLVVDGLAELETLI